MTAVPHSPALLPGTSLNGTYRITRVLASGSTFAITYLAHDERTGQQVVIKEFLPKTLAGRAPDQLSVHPYSADDAASFARAVRRFMREADLLAEIAHPNIPRVRGSFEANGTAYLVLQCYEGQTLTDHVAAVGDPLPPDLAAGLVLQVLHGLGALHADGIIHGYISPDNILVDANWRAILLGLGTTRHVVGPKREPVAGFAPIEQYASREVGPWTDVYACAAVLYRIITGQTPPSAVERSAGQTLSPPTAAAATLPSSLVKAVMAGLAQLPDARPHSAEEFRRRLDASLALEAQRTSSRVEERGARARLSGPILVETAIPEAEERDLERDAQEDAAQYEEKIVFVTPEDGPRDSLRRLVRLVFGVGGAATMVLLLVSVIAGKNDNSWAREADADIAAAMTTSALTAGRAGPGAADAPRRPTADSFAQPVDSAPRAQPTGAGLELMRASLRQAGSDLPRDVPRDPAPAAPSRRPPARGETREEAPSRPASGARTTGRGEASSKIEPRSSPSVASAPSVSLALPSPAGQPDVPTEVLAGLRERLRHGNENVEFGEYAGARRIYRAALDRVAALSDRHGGSRGLSIVKEELEQAADRAYTACTAQNEVTRKRNGKAVPCD